MHVKKGVAFALSAVSLWKFQSIEVPGNFESPIKFRIDRALSSCIPYLAIVKSGFKAENFPIQFRDVIHSLVKKNEKDLNPNVTRVDTKLSDVPVRIYTPNTSQNWKNSNIIVYYHGGGFFFGSKDMFDDYLSELSIKLDAVAIFVDYRLSPEHPFPAGLEDCYSVTKHILDSKHGKYGDPNKVIIAGDSAGGNITAVLAQRFKEEKCKRQPKLQVLIYPWVQMFNNRLPSAIRYEKSQFTVGFMSSWYFGIINDKIGDIISYNQHTSLFHDSDKFKSFTDINLIPEEYKKNRDYYENYNVEKYMPKEGQKTNDFGVKIKKLVDSRVSPGLADQEKLKGLPEAYIIVAEMDPLKDETLIYAERLRQADCKVKVHYYENAAHGFSQKVGKKDGYQVARDAQDDLVRFIKEN